ncbi:unnamed protein product [Acanthoscelides obtectus]|uniref:Transmembrane protein n=1 Tax=Acanthoscelides obtectus TaxID=200917 RepID=A0A9P0LT74_ACAOB|nr:unnamed protein product [Acanthoscelides obtectus]CAK1670734.1 hypothetical protein AOBTE_LOCUS27798 [Acanthoscelides obtectus]
MDVDTELMFECLIYLNAFYFPVFGICETIMTAAKYNSIVDTPDIVQDAAVAFTKLSAELIKMVIYKRFKNVRRKITTAIVVFFTFVTFAALIYQLFLQKPIMRLEYILNSITIMLATTEIVFGILDLLPCCQKVHYY